MKLRFSNENTLSFMLPKTQLQKVRTPWLGVTFGEPLDPILELKKWRRFRRNIRIIAKQLNRSGFHQKKNEESDII